jgi:hypothetical protein
MKRRRWATTLSWALVSALTLLCGVVRAGDYERAEALLDANKLAEAREAIEAYVKAEPKLASGHVLFGQVLLRFCELEAAKAQFEVAIELAPDEWGSVSKSYLAEIAFFHGQDARARELLEELPKKEQQPEILHILGPSLKLKTTRSKKGHYLVYTDAALRTKKGDVYAALMLELIFEAYSKVFPWKTDPKLVNRVFVFSTTASFNRFNRAIGDDESDAAGLYLPGCRLLIINADPGGASANAYGFTDDVIDTLFHEAFHQFMHLHVDDAPVWFDEGLADYFGPSKQVKKRKLVVGVVSRSSTLVTRFERIQDVVNGRDDYAATPLGEFLLLDTKGFRGDRELVHYAQGWSLIHFLLHGKSMGKKGRKLVKGYFNALKQGRTREEAHAETFGGIDLEKLEQAWSAYVKRLKP